MRHALKWLVACLLALPAAAQEQPAAPLATAQPAAAPEAEKPADADKPADAIADQPAEEPLKPVATTDAQNSICLLLESAARANNLPVEFFARVIWQESRFRANAVGPMTRSGRRAQGIAQFMPGTAAERQLLNPFDPIQALPKSAEFLRDLRRDFGNLGLAAAAYNAGPRRVREWLAGTGYMPSETRHYVHAITGATVEQWAKGGDKSGDAADKKQQGGSDCGMLMARLKREPNPFVEALERRIETGSGQPWSVILSAGFSRQRILGTYAQVEQRHAAILTGHDAFITQTRLMSRGTMPFYQVRIGAADRAGANDICNRIRKNRGACAVLRNPQARG
ncbi:MAG: lytic transglycosylase domain-containing protein [Xanthobacteraceae bacterium]|nr:lytic transglycosylase domain-containing protein [Xanthobacteraceae bacterium]